MSAEIKLLPVWKRGATPHERLSEYAEMARQYPERFQKMVLVIAEDISKEEGPGAVKIRNYSYGCSALDTYGLLKAGENEFTAEFKR